MTSRLMFILKKDLNEENGNSIDDFRPISITFIFFKFLEKVLYNSILNLISNK
jgi:hypothetical protein